MYLAFILSFSSINLLASYFNLLFSIGTSLISSIKGISWLNYFIIFYIVSLRIILSYWAIKFVGICTIIEDIFFT